MSVTEKAILGYMIRDNSLDSPLLKTRLFSSPNNRLIFKEIRASKKKGELVDFVLLAESLKNKVEASYLTSLDDLLPFDRSGGVRTEAYFKVQVNRLLQFNIEKKIKQLAFNSIEEPNFLPQLKEILASYELETSEPIESLTVASNVDKLGEFIDKRRAGELWGLKTCFKKLNQALMGLREIIILTAETKTGKTTWVLQIATDIAESRAASVLYLDFENGPLNLMTRILSRKQRLKYQEELLNPKIKKTKEIQGGLLRFQENYKNFAIITDRKLSIENIRSRVFQLRQRAGHEEVLIVVDSLQKLPMEDLKDRRAAIDRWLRDFEELNAEDPDLTILMVSEVPRGGKLPKESGSAEYTAHTLLEFSTVQDEGDIEAHGDNGSRELWIRYARDVKAGGKIIYQANFDLWEFEEAKDRFS